MVFPGKCCPYATRDYTQLYRHFLTKLRTRMLIARTLVCGLGIPEDKMNEVFETFFTSKAEGMGMGLSIARAITEAHNGRIWAENQPGGATFCAGPS